ncbi:MAG: hypothetical protein JO161_09740, partial [Planctomycetaceae bacterium]|nr:hypothetical protein [Planctomycetaceae bacterium]
AHKSEPLRNGRGLRFTDWELVELSLVSVPANPSALVTQRSLGGASYIRAGAGERLCRDDDDRAARRRLSQTVARVRAELAEHRTIDPRVIACNAAFRLRRW